MGERRIQFNPAIGMFRVQVRGRIFWHTLYGSDLEAQFATKEQAREALERCANYRWVDV